MYSPLYTIPQLSTPGADHLVKACRAGGLFAAIEGHCRSRVGCQGRVTPGTGAAPMDKFKAPDAGEAAQGRGRDDDPEGPPTQTKTGPGSLPLESRIIAIGADKEGGTRRHEGGPTKKGKEKGWRTVAYLRQKEPSRRQASWRRRVSGVTCWMRGLFCSGSCGVISQRSPPSSDSEALKGGRGFHAIIDCETVFSKQWPVRLLKHDETTAVVLLNVPNPCMEKSHKQ